MKWVIAAVLCHHSSVRRAKWSRSEFSSAAALLILNERDLLTESLHQICLTKMSRPVSIAGSVIRVNWRPNKEMLEANHSRVAVFHVVFPWDGTSRCPFVPGQKKNLVPVSLCPGTRAGANVPGQTPLSRDVPGQNELIFFQKKDKISCFRT